MTETNHTGTTGDAPKAGDEPTMGTELIETDKETQDRTCPHRRWGLGLVLLLLILLGAGGYAGYYLQGEIAGLRMALDTDLQSLHDSQGKLAGELQTRQDSEQQQDRQLERLREQQAAMEARLQRLVRSPHKDSRDWVLAEAEYLIRAADTRLRLERDTVSAALALEQADQRLADLALPDLIPVRKQLRQDINNLHAVTAVDIPGKALLLSDLAERVVSLPMKAGMGRPALKAETAGPATPEQAHDWLGMLAAVWADLKSLIVIRRQEAPDAMLYDPERNEQLYQNIQLELLSARLSMLRRDSKNMRASVKRVIGWLQTYFNTTDSAVGSALSSLEALQGLDLSPPLPTVSKSLRLLQDYQHRRAEVGAS